MNLRRSRVWWYLTWPISIGVVTLILLLLRPNLDRSHVALAYLLLVLAASARDGFRVGVLVSAVAFLLFDWYFLLPYNTLQVGNPLDWLVLVAFIIAAIVAASMLHKVQVEAREAKQRAAEIDQFATLGAETLKAGSAQQALRDIADVIRVNLELSEAAVLPVTVDPETAELGDGLLAWVIEHGAMAVRRQDGTTHLTERRELGDLSLDDVQEILLPLISGGAPVGVLRLRHTVTMQLAPAQRRFLAALAHYAAWALERERLESANRHAEALREADRLKDALLASVSHDLRTPLTTIKALARELIPLDDRAADIEQEADRLNRLVADLLDLSRLQAGGASPRAEINAVDDLIGAVLRRVSGALAGQEIRVLLQDGGTLLAGRFDFSGAVRILVNLIENAHKFSPSGTPIELHAKREGDILLITVSDCGPGVPEIERERIFEPFYRPDGTAPDVGGAGLGLAIARRLAEAQAGTLRCSARPGGGSIFTLTLPAIDLPTALSART